MSKRNPHSHVSAYVLMGLPGPLGIWAVWKGGMGLILHAFFLWMWLLAFLMVDIIQTLESRSSMHRR